MGRSVAAQDGSGGAERAAFDQRRKRDRKRGERRHGMVAAWQGCAWMQKEIKWNT
jgi:hypothetical protein